MIPASFSNRAASGPVLDPLACAALLEAIGDESFAGCLLSVAGTVAEVEEVFAWSATDGAVPQVLAAASRLGDQKQRVRSYAGSFYRSDPLIEHDGLDGFFIRVVAAHEIGFAEYRQICFARPLFDHKISFIKRASGQSLVLNFYLRRSSADPDAVVNGLTALATLAMASLYRREAAGKVGTEGAAARIATRIRSRFGQLSEMEARVLAHMALALPPGRIASLLGIQATTVKTYRARALAKCGCREPAEILAWLAN